MYLSPGARLGPYEILAPIGAGGMGEVYRGRDTRLGREVALKVLPEALTRDAERLARFDREARAVSSLNHPHICILHDIGHQDGIDYLVMEYIEGETLLSRLAKGPMPLEQDTALRGRGRRRPGPGPSAGCLSSRPEACQHYADEIRGEAA